MAETAATSSPPLTDLSFGPSIGSGELSALTGKDTKHDYTMLKYPLDLGSADVPHYVTFFINLPISSKYVSGNNATNVVANQAGTITTVNNRAATGTSSIAGFIPSGVGGVVGGAATTAVLTSGNAVGETAKAGTLAAGVNAVVDLSPKLARIKTAISIYMPDTVVMDYSHNYQETSLTEALGKLGTYGVIGAGVADALKGTFTRSPAGMEAVGQGGAALGLTTEGLGDIALKGQNMAVNPQVELIYKGTANREFVFEFRFQPRSKAEASQIRSIIYTFRRFSAPELQGAKNGRYFINPASFDIKFYYGDNENINLARISTCVLENLNVNYSGAGQYATFNDGMPAQIDLQMRFKEVDVITRELIEKFGY
jgi:Tail-tube assembly protein